MGPRNSHKTGPKLSKIGPKLSQTGPKLSKIGPKFSKMSSNGRVNLKYSINQSQDPEIQCVLAPLGSPTGVPKWLFALTGSYSSVVACMRCTGTGWYQGGYTGGYQGGLYPVLPSQLLEEPSTAKRAP